jgi:DedD protein
MRTQTLKLGDAPEPSAGPAMGRSASPAGDEATASAGPPTAAEAATPAAGARGEPEPEAEATLVAANRVAEPPKQAPAAASPPKQESAVAGDWTVQLGSFEDEANARRLAQRAATFGYKADVSSSKNGARTLYRVRVGPQATRAAADAAASALRAHGVEARVVAAR